MPTLVNRMIAIHERLSWVPYTSLEKLKRHRFGTLRLWPKWKLIKAAWEQLEKKEQEKAAGVQEVTLDIRTPENLGVEYRGAWSRW